ncbi:MAG TPA: HisA/HisF-related TIM barrel protein [Pseudacidobacterium sp.]|jgi:phosphoribosylformimino-5-aminoimidazole carboxamide ribotide isomerase|nr:HisA/HisF-related TIM barrel protein [Pseudacidobacterium sp.]
MLIPSIDLMGGRIVQLVRGEKLKLAFDDFEYWIERFSAYPMVQLIDLDAAMRQGNNAGLIEKISRRLPCQVGGGIATINHARQLLAVGAKRVIFGSALFGRAEGAAAVNITLAQEIAKEIGRDQFVASIDTKAGRVAIKGWKEQAGLTPHEAIIALNPYCGAFLYTHVDTEGTMQGFPLEAAKVLRALTDRQLIVAGGIREQAEIDALHELGVDAVAGMAIYTGALAT